MPTQDAYVVADANVKEQKEHLNPSKYLISHLVKFAVKLSAEVF